MKYTLSWLADHLEAEAGLAEVVETMIRVGMEVEHVDDPAARLAAFSVARILAVAPHPNADRLRVCQVETVDGAKEIVCGAPNARAGLVTIYAPIGAFIPGTGITLEPRSVRGVVSNGMLCSGAELELSAETNGILELAGAPVGTSAAEALGLEAVIDFEVTPNRPDWLGVRGIARDLAAAGLGRLKAPSSDARAGAFPCPIRVRLAAPEACPAFAGRLIRGVRNGPSPDWLRRRLLGVGLRPINALVDITNFLTLDQARPLHVYDAAKLTGGFLEARLGRDGEAVAALDGKIYRVTPEICAIADDSGAIGLGGVIGGVATGCSEATTEVFIESAWFDPVRTLRAGRELGIVSDAQYRFARGVDPASLVPGIEAATRLILAACGGEPSQIVFAGEAPGPSPPVNFDPADVGRLAGLEVPAERAWAVLGALGFARSAAGVQPPSWRRDIDSRADLVEEVARIVGYDAIAPAPLPARPRPSGSVLTERQKRLARARRYLSAAGYREAVTFSFLSRAAARLFGGGEDGLVLDNPIAAELDCLRPSILPGLIAAAALNARRGRRHATLFEIGPVFAGPEPGQQRAAIAALQAGEPEPERGRLGADLLALKADLLGLLEEIGAPAEALASDASLDSGWWRPGRRARLRLGRGPAIADFGEVHPRVLAAMQADPPMVGFELWIDALPEPRRRAGNARPPADLSTLMPVTRDLAFVVASGVSGEAVTRAARAADRALIAGARIFDVYRGPGVGPGEVSMAIEIILQPRGRTLTDAEIEAALARVIASVTKATGGRLRGA